MDEWTHTHTSGRPLDLYLSNGRLPHAHPINIKEYLGDCSLSGLWGIKDKANSMTLKCSAEKTTWPSELRLSRRRSPSRPVVYEHWSHLEGSRHDYVKAAPRCLAKLTALTCGSFLSSSERQSIALLKTSSTSFFSSSGEKKKKKKILQISSEKVKSF